MLENSLPNLGVVNRLPDLLVVQRRRCTASLIEQGYAGETVRLKVKLVTDFGEWLKRDRVAIADLDEQRVEAFLKHRRRVHRGNLKTLQQVSAIPTRVETRTKDTPWMTAGLPMTDSA